MTSVPFNADLDRRLVLKHDQLAWYRRMVEIRYFEDRVNDLFAEGLVHGTTHTCQGQEAVAVGLAAATEPTDQVVCTYRGHGVALALGVEPSRVLGEIMGRVTGVMGGLGGSMHLSEPSLGLLPTMAIVGAGIPIAVGAALTASTLETGAVGLAVFGDGASNIGAFHEGLNLASVWQLPVVFICENNLYGEYTPIDRTTPISDIARRADSYGMPGRVINGQEVKEVFDAVSSAVGAARAGEGPQLLEMKTYRYSGHSRADKGPYRPDGELEAWLDDDPIHNLASRLLAGGTATAADLEQIVSDVEESIESVVVETLKASSPGPEAMLRNIYPMGP